MKIFKKIASALLAAAMIFSLSTTAVFAEGEVGEPETPSSGYTITINGSDLQDGENYIFTAYQIFAGDTYTDAETGIATLSNIEWGDGIVDAGKTALLEYYQAKAELTDPDASITTAEDVAAMITTTEDAEELAALAEDHLQNGTDSTYDSTNKYTISDLEGGYYLVVNTSVSAETGSIAYTSYIMQIAEDITVRSKALSILPTVDKTVTETNDTTGVVTAGQTAADYDFGDDVPFNLTATLTNDTNYLKYEAYFVGFHDELSEGLSFNNDVVVTVKIGTETYTVADSCYTVTSYTTDQNDISGRSYNLSVDIDDIFSLVDDQGDDIVLLDDSTGLVDEVIYISVDYTAELLDTAATQEDNTVYLKYSNNPLDSTSYDYSVEHKVIVNNYSVVVNKVDDDGNALPGAGFTLYKYDADEGYVLVKAYAADDRTTQFTFAGLDAGTYKIVETTTPKGYNTADELVFTLYADYDAASGQAYDYVLTAENASGTVISALSTAANASSATFVTDEGSAILTTTIVNNAGNAIPSTGGIGTTILYVGGVCLVIAAAAYVVIMKKRKSAMN